ncbi:hypothetical protein F4860DRAFT_471478 [Xylaria cubensis]|nr:hypothetical protein F4860DRAFT_471478 [Xylaria cubensis]
MEHAAVEDKIVEAFHCDLQLTSSPPQQWIPLDSECSFSGTELRSSNDQDEAHSRLVLQRKSDPKYRPPESQKRHIFRSKGRQELESNELKWQFKKHEVAKAFNTLLAEIPLPRSGIAKALLNHVELTSIDELWYHLNDPKLEGKMKRRFCRRSIGGQLPNITWLETATFQRNLDYVQLLCERFVSLDSVNHALGLALQSKLSLNGIETMLKSGATAFIFKDRVREYIEYEDDAFVRLLLSYPAAMTIEAWRYCLGPQLQSINNDSEKNPPHILKICLLRLPKIACGSMILESLQLQNVPAMKILLDSVSSDDDLTEIHEGACKLACRITDHNLREDCFTALSQFRFLGDRLVLREELMRDIKARRLSLIRILVDANVKLDIEPNDAMHLAASQIDNEILLVLRDGNISSPASEVLYSVPVSASESDVLRLIEILSPRGLRGEPLSWRLTLAVAKEQSQLVSRLLEQGASVEYGRTFSIRTALGHANNAILKMLIKQPCSPEILSAAIRPAMALEPRQRRYEAMQILLSKGLPSQKLGGPLQYLIQESDEDIDYELIQSLLQHRAPVDTTSNGVEGPLVIATKKGNLLLLHMLCQIGLNVDTVSTAVPFAFNLIHTSGLEVSLQVMEILLKHGAGGVPVHQTLLASTEADSHQDNEFRIASLLLERGADANYAAGASYASAVRRNSIELLVMLCTACAPNQASLQAVLPLVIHPQYYNSQALEALLTSSPDASASLDSCWASRVFRNIVSDNPHLLEIISSSLRHGLNVDIDDGILLRFAIREVNFEVLERILCANPSLASLEIAFRDANSVENRNVQLELVRLLLEQAGSAEIGQSRELFTETAIALNGDLAGLQLVLQHKAMVDCDDGKSVLAAAAEGAVDVLDLLLLSGPSESTIKRACLLTAKLDNLSSDQKLITLQHLVTTNGGMSAETASDLLLQSVVQLPEFIELPRLLLAHGAIVEYAVLKAALETARRDLFLLLFQNTANQCSIVKLFRGLRRSTMQKDRQYWAYKCLLRKDIPVNDISEALLGSLTSDPDDLGLPKLLLNYGAAVDYAECASFGVALKSKSHQTVRLLCSYLVTDQKAVNTAFDLITHTDSPAPHVRVEAYRLLLSKGGINKASIQHVLEGNLAGENRDASVLDLMLMNGADPNKDGAKCFFTAIGAEAETEFGVLARQANTNPLLQALMGRFADEKKIAHWFRICLKAKGSLSLEELYQNDLMFKCMRKFPQGHELLKLLLEYQMIDPNAAIDHSIRRGWPPERCTALIWALFSSEPRIENDTILALLSTQGSENVNILYRTRRTNVSAAFGCLLDKSRIPVLEVLLNLGRTRVLKSKMLGTTFGYLAAYPKIYDERLSPSDGEINLGQASVFVGNFEAYRAMKIEETADEGNLHLAAQLALPLFVQWFLRPNSDNPNRPDDKYECLTPLALAVASHQPMPWCKIADQENDWKVRMKQTIALLVDRTDLKWRHGALTVLHYAIGSGPWMTTALIQALDIKNEPLRDDMFLYEDKDGLFYSPDEYVDKLLKVDKKQKADLLASLRLGEFDSRFYREVMPDTGKQPAGYKGLPRDIARAWEEHEAEKIRMDHARLQP